MTLSTGMTFGEMTMLLDLHFLNDVCADSDVTVAVLPTERYADMTAHEPGLKLALLERLAAGAYEQLDVVLRSLLRP